VWDGFSVQVRNDTYGIVIFVLDTNIQVVQWILASSARMTKIKTTENDEKEGVITPLLYFVIFSHFRMTREMFRMMIFMAISHFSPNHFTYKKIPHQRVGDFYRFSRA